MNTQATRILNPWRALAAAALLPSFLAGEVAAQAPASNPTPAQASAETTAPPRARVPQGRVEGTVTFSWAAGANPSSPMAMPVDPAGRFRSPMETSPFPRPSFSTVTIAAYPLKPGPNAQEAVGRNARAPAATAIPDDNGRFMISLDPGEYEVVAIAETRPGRSDRVPTRSTRVHIEPGKTERCLLSF